MSKYATGKYAKAISDRSGMEFPYREMVREWNGAFVHVSEYEPKQPQLEPKPQSADGIALLNTRTDRVEPVTPNLLPGNPFSMTSGSSTVTVKEPSHGRATSDTVVDTNSYTFSIGTSASVTEKGGGMTVTAGPVTISP